MLNRNCFAFAGQQERTHAHPGKVVMDQWQRNMQATKNRQTRRRKKRRKCSSGYDDSPQQTTHCHFQQCEQKPLSLGISAVTFGGFLFTHHLHMTHLRTCLTVYHLCGSKHVTSASRTYKDSRVCVLCLPLSLLDG